MTSRYVNISSRQSVNPIPSKQENAVHTADSSDKSDSGVSSIAIDIVNVKTNQVNAKQEQVEFSNTQKKTKHAWNDSDAAHKPLVMIKTERVLVPLKQNSSYK